MARPRRLYLPGLSQHVIQRGNNRCDMFRTRSDYETFLDTLYAESRRHYLDVHAYVLMTNHVHLLVTPRCQHALPLTVQAVGRRYVPAFNRRYERTGGLFEGRYRAMHVESERYWLTCQRYIEMNPVRAGLVPSAAEYRWSSYGAHAHGSHNELLTAHPLYLRLGSTSTERQRSWRALCEMPVSADDLEEIRHAANADETLVPLALPEAIPEPPLS